MGKTNIISPVKEIQQEILLKMDLMVSEKLYSVKGQPLSYEDVVELDILQTITAHLVATFELTTEEVPFEILGAWSMLKVHKDLLSIYNRQSKLNNDKYNEILDLVANKIFISLFVTH